MPALFVFLLKVNIALLLFCAGYYLVLRHLTFYTLNRVYLMAAIVFATLYPRINLDNFAQRHQQLTQPVQAVVWNLQAPAETLVKPLTQPAYWQWAEVLFFVGAAILAIRLLMQLFSLYKVYRSSKPAKIHGHAVRVIDGDSGPFSFWKHIYVNPIGYEADDLKSILQHEQVHTDEWHTLDVLMAELSIIFYWFNPGVWLMRKAVRENIEFITDRKILQKGADSKKYQYSLLNVSFSNTQPGIANHFNISTLKKRIIMMNAKRSSKTNLTRYVLLLPVVLVCLLSFSFSKAELIKKSKSTYKEIAVTVSDIALTNPVISFFQNREKSELTAKKIDTIKIIRSGHKDTIKIVQGNGTVYNLSAGYRIGNLNIDTNGIPGVTGYRNFTVLNLKTDTIGARVQLRRGGPGGGVLLKADTVTKVMINGKVYTGNHIKLFKDTILTAFYRKDPNHVATTNPVIHIRGARSSNGDEQPLIIVDGVPHPGSMNDINPQDIRDLEILKDGSATRLYGAKAANGVIIVTTKQVPSAIKPMVTYSYSFSNDKKVDSLLNKMHGFTVTKEGVLLHEGDTVKHIRVNGVDVKNMPRTVQGYSINADKNSPITVMGYSTKRSNETNIDNLSAKLVFINGKEVSEKEFKKLSAADIQNIAVKSGDEMIKKYGDKAKDGVVFITTKKEK